MSAIGIAGIGGPHDFSSDRFIAMSGPSTSGEVMLLLLDKTGTITLGNGLNAILRRPRPAMASSCPDAAQLSSLADENSGRPIHRRAREKTLQPRGPPFHHPATFVPFSAQPGCLASMLGRPRVRKGALELLHLCGKPRSQQPCELQFFLYLECRRNAAYWSQRRGPAGRDRTHRYLKAAMKGKRFTFIVSGLFATMMITGDRFA